MAFSYGFDFCAASALTVSSRHTDAYESWCEQGMAAEMSYLTRDLSLRTQPQKTFPTAASVLTLGVSYYRGDFPEKPGSDFGRVARYAWGLDYHTVIQSRLEAFAAEANSKLAFSFEPCTAVDTKPLLERAFAEAGRAGFIGKNTVFIGAGSSSPARIRYHVGSWIFLCELLLNIPVSSDVPSEETPLATGCGGCTRCLDACPTDAFVDAYRLDSRKCISYQTIENKGVIPRALRSKIGDWIFGCDVCQQVCPFNARAAESRWREFSAAEGAGPWLSLKEIFTIKDQPEFKKRFQNTALLRTKRKGLIRNACVVAGNSGDESLVPYLEALVQDGEPVVRAHSIAALYELASTKARRLAEERVSAETDADVQSEYRFILEGRPA